MVSERAAGFISGTLVAVIALFTASVFPRLMVSILPQPQFVASDGTPMSSKPRVSTASNAEAKARQDAAWDNPCPFLKTAWVQGLIEPDEMGYVPKKTIQELMDWAGVGRAVFPPDPYLSKFGTSGLPIGHLALNRPADSRIMHHAISDQERMLRLEDFTNYSVDGVFDRKALQSAISDWNREGMGDNANLIAMRGEMVTMLTVFGHAKVIALAPILTLLTLILYSSVLTLILTRLILTLNHAKGSISRSYVNEISDVLSIDDVEGLWLRNEWPKGWLEHRRQYEWGPLTNIDLMMGSYKP